MSKNIPNIYITLWLVYYLQGLLYQEGGLLSQSLLVILLLASLYFLFYANMHFSLPKPMRVLTVMVVVWSVYGIIPMVYGIGQLSIQVKPFEYIKNIYMSLLPIFAFYVFVKKGALSEDTLRRWVVLFIIVAISSFYKHQIELARVASDRGSTQEEFTNGAGYILVSVLPLLPLYWRKPVWQYIMLGVCMLYVIIGFKRGAILTGVLCSLWMIYTSFHNEQGINGNQNRKKTVRLIFSVILIISSVFFVQYLMSTSDYFNYRLEDTLEGHSSDRGVYYNFFISYFFNNMSPSEFLFGLGANGTLKIFYNVAHHDWLEIAIDNGAIMLIIYFIYWVSMLKMFFKGNSRNMANMMFGMFIIIYLFKSFFSFSYSDIPVYSSCALGYAMATYMPKTNPKQQKS